MTARELRNLLGVPDPKGKAPDPLDGERYRLALGTVAQLVPYRRRPRTPRFPEQVPA